MRRNLLSLMFLLFVSFSFAQETDLAKFKSMFILNFIRHLDWPESSKKGDFAIGIIGDKKMVNNLKNLSSGKKYGYQDIIIKELSETDDKSGCQIIFVSSDLSASKFKAVVESVKNNSKTLIISDKDGATDIGSMINFVIKNDKLMFEINTKVVDSQGITLSSSLKSMNNAIVI